MRSCHKVVSSILSVLLVGILTVSAAGQHRQSRDGTPEARDKAMPPQQEVLDAEFLQADAFGAGIIESWDAGLARQQQQDLLPPDHKPAAPFARRGEWNIPSRRSTFLVKSGEHYITNKYGDTVMGVGFPKPVTMHGVWILGQGASGVWPAGVRVVTFRGDQEVGRTDWFEGIAAEPTWLAIEQTGVDRIVFEAKPSRSGNAWFGIDDFTYSQPAENADAKPERIVLTFDDLNFRARVTESAYGGLNWEFGAGKIPAEDSVPPPVVPPGFEDRPAEPEEAENTGTARGVNAPALTDEFIGIIRGDAGQFSYPPDTCGAVGISHVVVVVNRTIAVYSKTTGNRLSVQSLGSFQPGTNGDPRVAYDPHHSRWIVISTDFNDSVYLAYSLTDNALGSWFKTSFVVSQGADASRWPDYPTLGVDAAGIYVGAYMVGGGHSLFAVDKAPLLAPSPSLGTVSAFRNLAYEGALQPAITWGDSGGEYIASRASSTQIRIRQITGFPSTPQLVHVGFANVPSNGGPPDAPALGSSTNMDTVGSRLMNAQWINGNLWTANATSSAGRAAVRWYRINTATLVDESGLLSDPSLHYYFPSIAANMDGDAAIGFSGSDASQYIGAYYSGREAESPAGQMALPIQYFAGGGSQNNIDGFGRNRWGDYSLTVLDPTDERTLWTIQTYGHSTDIWGSRIAKLEFDDIDRPINDDCGVVPIDLVQGVPTPFTTVDATTDGTAETTCGFTGGDQIENDVWFRYIPDCTGTATISICDADFDSRLAVYFVLCPFQPDESIACDDNGCGGTASQLSMPVTVGSTYWVRVGGAAGEMGTGNVSVTCDPPVEECPADIVGNNDAVDVFDLLELLENWGTDGTGADIADPDNVVDVFDLLALLEAWGACP